MFRSILLCLLMILSGIAQAAETDPKELEAARKELEQARAQLGELAQRIADLSMRVGEHDFALRMPLRPGSQRLMLGILIGPDTQGNGVQIAGVTPNGPAEKAGLRSGDLLVAVDGKSLKGDRDAQREAIDTALAARKAGDTLNVEIEREGKRQALSLTLQDHRIVIPALPPMLELFGHHPGPDAAMHALPPDFHKRLRESLRLTVPLPPELDWEEFVDCKDEGNCRRLVFMHGDAQGWKLETLEPELAEYFSNARGVLVLSADATLTPELRAGDVITEVDGTPVADVRALHAALRGREAGERVRLEVLRKNKSRAIEIEAREPRMPVAPRAHPHPGAAPVPAHAPAPAPRAKRVTQTGSAILV